MSDKPVVFTAPKYFFAFQLMILGGGIVMGGILSNFTFTTPRDAIAIGGYLAIGGGLSVPAVEIAGRFAGFYRHVAQYFRS